MILSSYAQKFSGRAKICRIATLACYRGFWASADAVSCISWSAQSCVWFLSCVHFLPEMLYSSRKVPGTSTFTSCPVPKSELREELLELLELCCWRRSCCLLCSSSLICSCLCCSILSFSSLSCSCWILCCSILSFSSLACSRLSAISWILICSRRCCSARAAAWACWALKASDTRLTILGCRMVKILLTKADFEEEEDEEEEEEELKLEELDPVEENFDPDEKELCC